MSHQLNSAIEEELNRKGWLTTSRVGWGKHYKTTKESHCAHLKIAHKDHSDRIEKDIQILSDERFFECVPRLAAISEKKVWHITEEGKRFEDYWNEISRNLNKEEVTKKAIELVKEIASSLSVFHKEGILHLDIKPDNLIVIKDRIKIIDFATFANVGEIIEKVRGNKGFSPDACMYKGEVAREWFDIFNISQILIWLLDISPKKNWQRPRDWRYARYNMEDDRYIRAITALCSDEKSSPKNIPSFIDLLDSYFANKNNCSTSRDDVSAVTNGIRDGKSIQSIKQQVDQLLVESNSQQAQIFYSNLIKELKLVEGRLQGNDIDFELRESIPDFSLHESFPYNLQFAGDYSSFNFRVAVASRLPSLINILNGLELPNKSNIITFAIQIYANLNHGRFTFPSETKRIVLKNNGQIFIGDEFFGDLKHTDISEIINLIEGWIYDKKRWELINRNI